jgi:DNA processing protein
MVTNRAINQAPSQASGLSNPDGLTSEEELCWLALRMVPGLGTRRIGVLLERLRTPQAIFRASASQLEASGLTGAVARSVASGCSFEDAASQQQKLREAGAQLITLGDARYPEALRKIYDPPPVLFVRGRADLLSSICIGVVGTRHPTPYGVAAAEKLSGDLARAGVTITSGMARGIDTAAHKAALAAEGKTIAVLGCGVDVVYPSENRKLATEIAARGLIISEFPMEATAFPQNFPIRNRIISGLSCGILVIEGAQYSGSAITARLAIDQGREIFAVPGNITSKMSWGPNLLIKQGAKLVQDWNDVVVDLPKTAQRRLIDEGRQRIMDEGLAAAGESSSGEPSSQESHLDQPHQQVARRILATLKTDQATQLDVLVDTFEEASPSEIIAALFELEMLGLARQLPGRNFVKVW